MTTKLYPITDLMVMASLATVHKDVYENCNKIVSEFSRAAGQLAPLSKMPIEEIYEHQWMMIAAMLRIRAAHYSNYHVIEDWQRVFEG